MYSKFLYSFPSLFTCIVYFCPIYYFIFLTGFGPADIGYVVRSNEMKEVLNFMNKATNTTTENKLKKVRDARYLYTYKGLLEQIEKWFFDPFGVQGGYLRCKKDDRKQKMYASISSL